MNKLSEDEILLEANTLYDIWPALPAEEKRKIAESLIEKIVVTIFVLLPLCHRQDVSQM